MDNLLRGLIGTADVFSSGVIPRGIAFPGSY